MVNNKDFQNVSRFAGSLQPKVHKIVFAHAQHKNANWR